MAVKKQDRVPEAAVMRAVEQALTLRGWLVVRMNSSQMPVGESRWLRAYHIIGFGSAGFPDLLALKGNQALLIEVKPPHGRINENQERFSRFAAAHGVIVHVCRSAADAFDLLDERSDAL